MGIGLIYGSLSEIVNDLVLADFYLTNAKCTKYAESRRGLNVFCGMCDT